MAALDGVPLHPQAQPALAAAEPALRRRLRSRRRTRGELVVRSRRCWCGARPSTQVGMVRRGLLHVQRGSRLDDPFSPRRLEGAVYPVPRSCTSAARRTVARCTWRTCAATYGSTAKHHGPRAAERTRRLLLASLCLRAVLLRRNSYREGVRFLSCVGVDSACSSDRVPAAPRRHLSCCPAGRSPRAPGRRSVLGGGRLDVCLAVCRLGGRVRGRFRTSRRWCLILSVITVVALFDEGGGPRHATHARHPSQALVAGLVLGWFLWRVAGAIVGDGLFHEGRVRKLLDFRRPASPRRSTSSSTAACTPATRSRFGMASMRSSRGSLGSIRRSCCATSLRCSRGSRSPSSASPAWRSSTPPQPGASVALGSLALFCFAPGNGGSFATLSQPGAAGLRILVPAAVALFFSRDLPASADLWCARARPSDLRGVLADPVARGGLLGAARLSRPLLPVGAALLWLRPIVDQTNTHDPSTVHSGSTTSRSTSSQLVVTSVHHFRLAPRKLGRSGAVAVAALLLLPVLRARDSQPLGEVRRRWVTDHVCC